MNEWEVTKTTNTYKAIDGIKTQSTQSTQSTTSLFMRMRENEREGVGQFAQYLQNLHSNSTSS